MQRLTLTRHALALSTAEPSRTRLFVIGILFALAAAAAPASHATPISVDVYGTPYFSLLSDGKQWGDQVWTVIAPEQSLSLNVVNDEVRLHEARTLDATQRSGGVDRFSFLDLWFALPEALSTEKGFINYLFGDQQGQFTVEHVFHRTPKGPNPNVFSIMLWGFDYTHGAAFVLGFEQLPAVTQVQTNPVSEPSTWMLWMLGMLLFTTQLRTSRHSLTRD